MKKITSWLNSLKRDEGGNILAISALAIGIAALFMLQFGSLIFVMKRKDELTDIAKTACNEGLKPTRTLSDSDTQRTTASTTLFDNLAKDRGFTVTKRDAKQDFLSGTISASASVPSVNPLDADGTLYPISVSVKCQGIPPYPKLNDVLLSSDFTWPNTEPLRQTRKAWAIYTAQDLGWDSYTGPGIEVQDWSGSKADFADKRGNKMPDLSADQTSPYVIELDGYGNATMTKRIELHQGVYEFSLWYLARSYDDRLDPALNTNTIGVYLEGIRPAVPKEKKLTIFDTGPREWKRLHFEVTVPSYSIFDLTLAAEGQNDSYGGLFNTLEVKYIKRPKNLYPQDYK